MQCYRPGNCQAWVYTFAGKVPRHCRRGLNSWVVENGPLECESGGPSKANPPGVKPARRGCGPCWQLTADSEMIMSPLGGSPIGRFDAICGNIDRAASTQSGQGPNSPDSGPCRFGFATLYTPAFAEGVEGGFLGKRREARCAFSLRDCPAPPRPTARTARVRGGCRFLEAHTGARRAPYPQRQTYRRVRSGSFLSHYRRMRILKVGLPDQRISFGASYRPGPKASEWALICSTSGLS